MNRDADELFHISMLKKCICCGDVSQSVHAVTPTLATAYDCVALVFFLMLCRMLVLLLGKFQFLFQKCTKM